MADVLSEIRVELAKKPSTAGLWGMVATVVGVGVGIAALTFAIAQFAASVGG